MKNFLLGLLLITSPIMALATIGMEQCKDQSDYISQWTLNSNNLNVQIIKKDKSVFTYFDLNLF